MAKNTPAEAATDTPATDAPVAETQAAPAAPVWTPREQNDVKEYRPGSVGANVWAIADAITARYQRWASAAEVIKEGEAAGINTGSCRAGYASWRKFSGLAGVRVDNPEKAAEKAAKEAEKAAKAEAAAKAKAEKEAAKLAKAEQKAAEKAAKDAEKAAKAEQVAAEKAAKAEAAAAAKAEAAAAAAAETPAA